MTLNCYLGKLTPRLYTIKFSKLLTLIKNVNQSVFPTIFTTSVPIEIIVIRIVQKINCRYLCTVLTNL